ncbi:hypothetical protein ABID21_001796 [Pseudorhizobium tarimense]|uniref:Uncharacterized protein n=1 Tax=Pseudorhizobium tarimense TaxID=1079109 RepID=A0ABV2H562_9HYPH|nr:hypothetical protein [Pseudorhizobium tarimense]MCJ8518898.1 hypothetical protein [Pseudorhizobium tarimense]
MKRVHQPREKMVGPALHCVKATCGKAGASPKEIRKMLQLLGKKATMHELAHNLKDRPPKFR